MFSFNLSGGKNQRALQDYKTGRKGSGFTFEYGLSIARGCILISIRGIPSRRYGVHETLVTNDRRGACRSFFRPFRSKALQRSTDCAGAELFDVRTAPGDMDRVLEAKLKLNRALPPAGEASSPLRTVSLLGGPVKSGKIYGEWPGLEKEQLFEGRDLAVTTDFRAVLRELIQGHLAQKDLGPVFPGYKFVSPLGLLRA